MYNLTLNNNTVYVIGLVLNVVLMCYCFKLWKTLGNIKYFIVIQACLSSLTITANIAFELNNLEMFQQGKFLCYHLPVLVIFSLSLAVFNFTLLVFVRHIQITSNWQLRRSSAILIFVAVLGVSTVLSSPILYSIDVGWSIVRFDGCLGGRLTKVGDGAKDEKKVNINVVLYVFFFLVLQFIVPAIVIINRLLLILVHLWQEERSKDMSTKPKTDLSIKCAVNITSVIVSVMIVVFFLCKIDSKDDKALGFLNMVFHKCVLVSVAVLCWPWCLVEMSLERDAGDGQNISLVKDKKELIELNI